MTDGRIAKARLGTDGPEVGVQGLGCMGMSFAYGPSDAAESRATLERALELGVTLYDTAHAYGAGENERFLSPSSRRTATTSSSPPSSVWRSTPTTRPSGSSATTPRTSASPSRGACAASTST